MVMTMDIKIEVMNTDTFRSSDLLCLYYLVLQLSILHSVIICLFMIIED